MNTPLLFRLEVSADSPVESVKVCGEIFHNLYVSILRKESHRFRQKDKDRLERAFSWIASNKIPVTDDEEVSFPGLCLLVRSLHNGINKMTDIPEVVVKIKAWFEGAAVAFDFVERCIESFHRGMMDERKSATKYHLIPHAPVL